MSNVRSVGVSMWDLYQCGCMWAFSNRICIVRSVTLVEYQRKHTSHWNEAKHSAQGIFQVGTQCQRLHPDCSGAAT